jgi:hypothetical protein
MCPFSLAIYSIYDVRRDILPKIQGHDVIPPIVFDGAGGETRTLTSFPRKVLNLSEDKPKFRV